MPLWFNFLTIGFPKVQNLINTSAISFQDDSPPISPDYGIVDSINWIFKTESIDKHQTIH